MPRNLNSSLMKPFVALAIPGMYLFYKYNQYKRQQQEQNRRKVTERELAHLNHKIDKLLAKLDEHEPEVATTQEEECVVCITARATMQTYPCGHRVVCRKCFVKTIQTAVAQRMLPLRCVICRAKILRLKQSGGDLATTTGAAAGISPSPSTASSLSTFSACSSSFSLKSFRTSDSGGSRASCKSAPPQLSTGSTCSPSASSSALRSSSPALTANSFRNKSTSASALSKVAKQQVREHSGSSHKGGEPKQVTRSPSAQSDKEVVKGSNHNNNHHHNSNNNNNNNNVNNKEKSVSFRSNKNRSGHKLQSLPKATVRSRSPHKFQLLRPHRLEIIKEVE